MSQAAPTPAPKPAVSAIPERLIIRSWPKMIMFMPTGLLSLALGIAMMAFPAYQNLYGGIFVVVLALNLLIMTFDFPRGTWLTVIFAVVGGVFALLLLNTQLQVIKPLADFILARQIHASAEFFFFVFIAFLILFTAMWTVVRFDYWELEANEIIRHSGMLGDIERFPTAGIKFNKEITDVFEFLILGSGRLVLVIPSSPRPFVLDNVLSINKVTALADKVLEARMVRVEHEAVSMAGAKSANATAQNAANYEDQV
jgi:hypothetical protein